MKKLLFAICLIGGAAVSTYAQDSTATPAPTPSQQYSDKSDEWGDKEAIATSELPASIQKQLTSSDYTGWAVNKAYRKEKEGKTWYAVELKKGTEMKKVKFDAMGNVVKEKDKKDKSY